MAYVLIVDDEPLVARAHERALKSAGYRCEIAGNADEALQKLNEEPADLVLADLKMPGKSGIELTRMISKDQPCIAFVIVSGVDDPKIAELALQRGVYGYLVKPVEKNALVISVSSALRRRELEMRFRKERHELETKINYLERDLHQVSGKVNDLVSQYEDHGNEAIDRLARIIDLRIRENSSRNQRIGRYCEILAKCLTMGPDECKRLRLASLLRDVGKAGIPDSILFKNGKLTEEEERVLQSHTEIGYEVLSGSGVPLLDLAASISRTHHERFDGTGYPQQLVGDTIPIEGRIVTIASGLDALSLPLDKTVEAINSDRGKRYDPSLVNMLLDSMPDVLRVKQRFADR